MEVILIGKAFEVIGFILPILERIKLACDNLDEAKQLHTRLTRLHLILKEMGNKTFSTTTIHTLNTLLNTMGEISKFITRFEDKNLITKMIKAEKFKDEFGKFNEELSRLLNELVVCNTIDIKEDTSQLNKNDAEISGQLEILIGKMDKMNTDDSAQVLKLVNDNIKASQNEIKAMKMMFEQLMNSKNQQVTVQEIQVTKEVIIEKSKPFEIDYIKDLVVDTEEELGSGSFGTVYLGQWIGINVAVKRMKDIPFKDPGSYKVKSDAFLKNKAILKEVKAFEMLQKSPFIVKFYGVSTVDGNLAVITEYMDNNTLSSWLYFDENLPSEHLNKIQLGIARGLAYMHANGIAHNDIKSNNVMLDKLFLPRIIDLGMAKLTNSSNMSSLGKSRITGTDQWRAPEYWDISPEHLQSRKDFPFAGDVFSFSIVLGEICTKTIPWKDMGSKDMEKAVGQGMRPYSAKEIDGSIFEIIIKGWTQHPKDRISMKEMVALLDKPSKQVNKQVSTQSIPTKDVKNDSKYDSSTSSSSPNSIKSPTPQIIKKSVNLDGTNGLPLFKLVENALIGQDIDTFEAALLKLINTNQIYNIELFFIEMNAFKSLVDQIKFKYSSKFFMNVLDYFSIHFANNETHIFNIFKSCTEPLANLFLGFMSQYGAGTVKNLNVAVEYYKKLAELKIAPGYFYLAWCYKDGMGVEIDQRKAFEMYFEASKGGYSTGYHQVAHFYENGIYKNLDMSEAFKYYSKGAEFGESASYHVLGRLYQVGTGCVKDLEKSKSNFQVAISMGYYQSHVHLGNLYQEMKQYDKALECFKAAESQGLAVGSNNIGTAYFYGYGVPQDYVKAREYYELGAKSNVAASHYSLGVLYEGGLGINKNLNLALDYYRNAEKYGDTSATTKVKEMEDLLDVNSDSLISNEIIEDLVGPPTKQSIHEELEESIGNPSQYKKNFITLLNQYEIYYIEQYLITALKSNVNEYIKLYNTIKSDPTWNCIFLYFGIGCSKSIESAYQILKPLKDPLAIFIVAIMKLFGLSIDKNEKLAYEMFLSIKKHAYAAYYLGWLNRDGIGCNMNRAAAMTFYESAAKNNHGSAAHSLAKLYEEDKNYTKALKYYELGSFLGSYTSYNQLGIFYRNGYGVAVDNIMAASYYQEAANMGESVSFFNLGYLNLNGLGVPKDVQKAILLYKIAIQKGYDEAICHLGNIYTDLRDFSNAKLYFEKAMKLNKAVGFNNLGNLYADGQGVVKDEVKAFELFLQSANLGEIVAINRVGICYKLGSGCPIDYKKAVEYFSKAVELNHPVAFNNLGTMYRDGQYVAKNDAKAMELFQKGADLHEPNSCVNLGTMYYNGSGCVKDFTKARIWYEKSNGDKVGLFSLGIIYEFGLDVTKDINKAVNYYQQALDKGYLEANVRLQILCK
eukprot:NODE_121_length_17861_cov_0.498480.p1 type:complete len:1405 gc:universal NODE_121_length_17861_cov_0.498480:12129-7915(-)